MELGEEVARVLEASGGPPGMSTRRGPLLPSLLTPGLLEMERTPLSSRAATSRRVDLPPPVPGKGPFDTNRPSIIQRKKTQRFQNIAAAIAVIVIITLVIVGRRDRPDAGGIAGVISALESASAAAPRPHPKPKPSASHAVVDAGSETD
jgi:hypothetical protein